MVRSFYKIEIKLFVVMMSAVTCVVATFVIGIIFVLAVFVVAVLVAMTVTAAMSLVMNVAVFDFFLRSIADSFYNSLKIKVFASHWMVEIHLDFISANLFDSTL